MISTLDIRIEKVGQSRISEMDFHHIEFARKYSDHMFIADYDGKEWKDFRIIPYGNIEVSPANPAIHYGQSIFEGLKAYKDEAGQVLIFRPDKNYERMNKSAERMMMPQLPRELFIDAMHELINLDRAWVPDVEGTSLYIRPFMFATDEFIGVRPSDTYRYMIITCPVGAYYPKPVKVKIEEHFTRAVKGGTGYAKTAGNYAASLYPAWLAQQEGYDQLIWTDGQQHRYIEEAGTMNLMFMIDDTLITAPTGDTILAGVTRDSVLTLARDWGVKVEERPLEVQELLAAIKEGRLQEAFGTGTAATIAHIEAIGYRDEQYHLDLGERHFSDKVLETLDAIRTGKAEDKYGWNYRV
ncbi:MAG TPA: branched-chain amino acid aminotransferase [Flammeovirgaceae bacterium]|nr:branched-chain amino acid aminotransferase [Flammeovirgaceae bacterium]